jgi:hypothetical protein
VSGSRAGSVLPLAQPRVTFSSSLCCSRSLNPEALTALEAAYKKEVYPAFQASQLVDMAALQSWSAEQVKVAEAVLADTNKELAELNASLEVMMSSRTTIETTVAEKLAARPDLATQIDEEINTHQWNKDT